MVKIFRIALAVIFLGIFPLAAKAATIEIRPATGSFVVGDLVVAKIIVAGNVPVNAASVEVTFPKSIFSVESISNADSILNFWVAEPSFSRTTGVVKFEGVTLGGYNGSQGTLMTVRLRAVSPGTGSVSFQTGQVFANDGQGTEITSGLVGASFTVTPAPAGKPPVKEPAPEPEPEEVEIELIQPAPTLTAPEIMLGAKYGEPAIVGASEYPNADVLVTFVAADGAKIFITSTADLNGDFTVLVPSSLRRGTYTVAAVMVKADKTNSEVSNQITISIGSIITDLGFWGLGALALLLVIIALLAIKAFHHSRKRMRLSVHTSFDKLREDIDELDKGRAQTKLKKDIESIERSISREIDEDK